MRFLLILGLGILLSFDYVYSQDTISVKHLKWRTHWEYRGAGLRFKQLSPIMQTDSKAFRYYKKSRTSRILTWTFYGIGSAYGIYWGVDAIVNEPNYYLLIPGAALGTITWSFAFNAGRKLKKSIAAFNNRQRL